MIIVLYGRNHLETCQALIEIKYTWLATMHFKNEGYALRIAILTVGLHLAECK